MSTIRLAEVLIGPQRKAVDPRLGRLGDKKVAVNTSVSRRRDRKAPDRSAISSKVHAARQGRSRELPKLKRGSTHGQSREVGSKGGERACTDLGTPERANFPEPVPTGTKPSGTWSDVAAEIDAEAEGGDTLGTPRPLSAGNEAANADGLEVTPVSFSEVFDLPVDGLAALSSISQGSLSGRSGSAGSVSGRKSGRRSPSGSPLRLNGSSFFGESPLPTLTGRSSNSRDGLGSRGRDQRAGRGGVALSDGTVVGAAALSDAEPAAMASARMAGLFVRTPSAVARSRRGSRASGRPRRPRAGHGRRGSGRGGSRSARGDPRAGRRR